MFSLKFINIYTLFMLRFIYTNVVKIKKNVKNVKSVTRIKNVKNVFTSMSDASITYINVKNLLFYNNV